MGFAFCLGECFGCGHPFSFNPVRVPSIRDHNNVKQPVCAECVARANPTRIANGLEPIIPHPDAYSVCDESEINTSYDD
jgi:hypothetical protein